MGLRDEAEFMRGGCFALALHLHRKTGLPLYGLADTAGHFHHAFVLDGDHALDARGRVPLALIRLYKSRVCAGERLQELPIDTAEALMAESGVTLRQASAYARKQPALDEAVANGATRTTGFAP